jgi:hypothetical protein
MLIFPHMQQNANTVARVQPEPIEDEEKHGDGMALKTRKAGI